MLNFAWRDWRQSNHFCSQTTFVAVLLSVLVYGGAALYVFSKSAKFSLFKPAEEMVYISLDEQVRGPCHAGHIVLPHYAFMNLHVPCAFKGRTKGKAAIDVVGSQAGKSGGSLLQQLLLVISGGAIAGSLPVMFIVYTLMAQSWLKSVTQLSAHNPRYGHSDSVHPELTEDPGTESEDEGDRGSGQRAPVVAHQSQQPPDGVKQ